MKIFKFCVLLLFIITLTFATYLTVYKIAERYFFDKVFYDKSIAHGYIHCGDLCDFSKLGKRADEIAKLRSITFENKFDNKKVLGISENSEDYNISIIGDSYVFGVGVKENEQFQTLLEKRLNKKRKVNLYSYGFLGDSILDYLAKYEVIKENNDVDLYIFVIVDNDLLLRDKNAYASNSYKEIIDKCSSNGKITYYEYARDYIEQLTESLNNNANNCVLKETINRLPSNAIYFTTFRKQTNYDEGIDELDQNLRNSGLYIVSMEKGKSIEKFSDNKYWDDPWRYFSVSDAEKHPSKFAHQMFSEILVDEITNNPKWNFNKNEK